MNDVLSINTQVFLVFFFKLIHVDRFAVFQNDVLFFDLREVVFPDVSRAADRHGDDGTSGFCGNLEASFMEGEHIQFICIFVSGTFREDADGDAGFHFFNSSQDGF